MNTYVGGPKIDFPNCIMNPIKAKVIKSEIIHYLENNIEDINQPKKEKVITFFWESNKFQDFDVVSANTTDSAENLFLLQSKKNAEKRCVVVFDKKTNKLLYFIF